jgi:hypothetical protein
MSLHELEGVAREAQPLDVARPLRALLEVLLPTGTRVAVLPNVAPTWFDGYSDRLGQVGERYGMIARRERVCKHVGHGLASRLRPVAARLIRKRPGLIRRRTEQGGNV